MDKQIKRYEKKQPVKGVKECSDNTKPAFGKINSNNWFPSDRGDSKQKPAHKLINNKNKYNEKQDFTIRKEALLKNIHKTRVDKTLDAEDKKIIREKKYTLRLRSLSHVNSDLNNHYDISKTDKKNVQKTMKKTLNETDMRNLKETRSNNSKNSETTNSDVERKTRKRKPEIKIIMANNYGSRVSKTVTFVDQKKKSTMPLTTNAPTGVSTKHSKILESINPNVKVTVSRVSVKEQRLKQKTYKRWVRKHVTSPDTSGTCRVRSPPTEVAKWAPTSITHHTKPYYEAWVDTTLTAISKNYKKDQQYFDKQRFTKYFQRSFDEKSFSPEIMYENMSDEKFIGRIKVRQR